jgi:hypothetical protein
MAAVRVDMPDASVIADAHARVGLMGLPLTLIALTVSHVRSESRYLVDFLG